MSGPPSPPGARLSTSNKNRLMIGVGVASLALVLVAIGLVAGGVIVYSVIRDRGQAKPSPTECLPDPKLVTSIKDLEGNAAEMKLQMTELGNQTAALREQVETISGASSATGDLRYVLPPPYVQKVDDFFFTAEPRRLLSAGAAKDNSLAFGQPVFISHELITVPYRLQNHDYYLIVKITILDYYDLQFDVVWDSLEGQPR
jgi:hypothetical protein